MHSPLTPFPAALTVAALLLAVSTGCGDSSASMDAEGLRHTQALSWTPPAAFNASTLLLPESHTEFVFDFNTGEELKEWGALHVFERAGDAWRPTAFLTHLRTGTGPYLYEGAVAIGGDTILAPGTRESLVVFEKLEGAWRNTDEVELGIFLCTPEIVAHGDTIILVDRTFCWNGALTVIERTSSGWQKTGDVEFPTPVLVSDIDFDGETVVLGYAEGGVVVVFERAGDSFVEAQVLEPEDVDGVTGFGGAVAVSGHRLAVAALVDIPDRNTLEPELSRDQRRGRVGVVLTYIRKDGDWVRTDQQIPFVPVEYATFPDSRSLDLQGSSLLVGSPGDPSLAAGVDSFGAPGATERDVGSASLFEEVNGAWERRYSLKSAAPVRRDMFGSLVALNGDQILVATGDSGNGHAHMHIWKRLGGSQADR